MMKGVEQEEGRPRGEQRGGERLGVAQRQRRSMEGMVIAGWRRLKRRRSWGCQLEELLGGSGDREAGFKEERARQREMEELRRRLGLHKGRKRGSQGLDLGSRSSSFGLRAREGRLGGGARIGEEMVRGQGSKGWSSSRGGAQGIVSRSIESSSGGGGSGD